MFIMFNNYTSKLLRIPKSLLIFKFMMGRIFILRLKNQDLKLNINKIFKIDI